MPFLRKKKPIALSKDLVLRMRQPSFSPGQLNVQVRGTPFQFKASPRTALKLLRAQEVGKVLAPFGLAAASFAGGLYGLHRAGKMHRSAMHQLGRAKSAAEAHSAIRRAGRATTLAGASTGLAVLGPVGGVIGAGVGYAAHRRGASQMWKRAGQASDPRAAWKTSKAGAGSKAISRPLTGDYLAQHNLTHGKGGRFTAKGAKRS